MRVPKWPKHAYQSRYWQTIHHRDQSLRAIVALPGSHIPACHNAEQENSDLSCAICEIRKEKRFCPAIHGRICPQCCGEQREVTLDCPSDCPYLLQARQQAREHATAQKEQPGGQDREAMLPEIEIAEQFLYEREELILGISF